MSAVELQRNDSKTRDELKPGEFKVYLNDPENNNRGNFPTNAIKTSKYNVITFLPLNLIEQFQRLANVYFLLVVLIQFVPNLSPFSVWTSLLPLLFILAISAIKSAIEDWRRHRADARANSRCYRAVAVQGVGRTISEGGIVKLASRDVRVGSILKIEKGEEFPADMIVLATSNIDSSCYENTSALDGEAVPKLRVASSLTMHHNTAQQIGELRGAVTLKAPTAALHSFEGRITVKSDLPTSGIPAPLGVKQLVLRGSKLANTDWVFAMVIYTGAQTKMMLNRNPTRFKFTKFERQLNQLVVMLFIFNFLLCAAAAIICVTSDTKWSSQYDLDDQSFVGWLYALGTQYILFSFTIPLSLYVTIEIVKVGQAAFMEWDSQMRWISPVDGKEHGMQCKASALNEELGMIDYVFSDKTGTLTENEMELSCLSVAGSLCYMVGSAQHKAAVALASGQNQQQQPLTLHELAASVLSHGFDGTGTLTAEDHTATTFAERPITAVVNAAIMSGTDINVNLTAVNDHGTQLQTVAAMRAAGMSSGTGVVSLSQQHGKVISVAPAGSHSRAASGEHNHTTTSQNAPVITTGHDDNTVHGMRIHTAIMSQNGDVAAGGLVSVSTMPMDMPYTPVDHSEPLSGAFPVRWDGGPQTPTLPNRYATAAAGGLPPIRGFGAITNTGHINIHSGGGNSGGVGPRFHAEPSSPYGAQHNTHNHNAFAAYNHSHSNATADGNGNGNGNDNNENKVESLVSADPNFETWAHREFILSVLLCNSVLPVIEGEDPAKPPAIAHSPVDADKRKYIFQSQSPDEIALVDAIHRCGVTFHRRAGPELTLHLRLKECDVGSGASAALPTPRAASTGNHSPKRSESGVRVATATYKVVAELEFTSARRRMSVVIQAPDGTCKLYVKGADAALFPLIDKSLSYQQRLVSVTDGHVTDFAGTGSRTLVFAGRTLPRAEFDTWFAIYNEASTALSGRDAKVEKAFTLLEKNLYLLGATAVEDHLQAGVPEAIDFMLKAKLKVVVLTGDKKETAVTIAKQCNLIRDTARILYVNGNSMEETKASLDAAIHVMAKITGDSELLEMSAPSPRSRAPSTAVAAAAVAHGGDTPLIPGGSMSNHGIPTVIPPSPLMMPQPSPSLQPNQAPPRSITPIPLVLPSAPAPIALPPSSSTTSASSSSSGASMAQNVLPVPATGAAAIVGPAKEPSPHVSPQPSPHGGMSGNGNGVNAMNNNQQALSASIAAAEGLVSARKHKKLSFALAIDGMAMEWCITQYLLSYVALFKRCDTTVSYRSTPLQKAMAVKMAKKSLSATCLAVGDGANDVSMIQESDVGVGIMGKEGSHAAMSADYVVLRFKHLLRLIFVHGRYSFYRTAKVCLFSFYKNTAFPTPTWYFQFYCLGTGQAFFDPFLMSGFNMFFSSLPPFVVGMLEKDMGEDEVMAAPEAYDLFKKNSIFTVSNFFVWMGEAVYHSLITWFIALGHFGVTDVGLKSGKTGGLWYHGDTVFAAGVILVNIQMFVNCRNITWFNPGSCLLGILGYFIMLSMISYSYWITLAPDALGQMDYIYGSAIPYFYWLLALVACFIPQAVIRCYKSLWKPDVTQRLHRQMLLMKAATPSASPTHHGGSGNGAHGATATGTGGAATLINGNGNGNDEKAMMNGSRSHHTPPASTPMSRVGHAGVNGIPSTPSVHRTPATVPTATAITAVTSLSLMPPSNNPSHATIPPSPIRAH